MSVPRNRLTPLRAAQLEAKELRRQLEAERADAAEAKLLAAQMKDYFERAAAQATTAQAEVARLAGRNAVLAEIAHDTAGRIDAAEKRADEAERARDALQRWQTQSQHLLTGERARVAGLSQQRDRLSASLTALATRLGEAELYRFERQDRDAHEAVYNKQGADARCAE